MPLLWLPHRKEPTCQIYLRDSVKGGMKILPAVSMLDGFVYPILIEINQYQSGCWNLTINRLIRGGRCLFYYCCNIINSFKVVHFDASFDPNGLVKLSYSKGNTGIQNILGVVGFSGNLCQELCGEVISVDQTSLNRMSLIEMWYCNLLEEWLKDFL